jgi:Fe2+ or Zn2+ uptake regulation protein
VEITTEHLVDRCRDAGLKATPQRVAVLRAVSSRFDHPSAEGVLQAARDELPTLSLATVYKALDALSEAGVLTQIGLFDTKRYDANQHPHHHLICEVCGSVSDFDKPELTPKAPRRIQGFQPREVRLQIIGTCGTCVEAKREKHG